MKPQLDKHNVRFVAVGLEDLGVDEFAKGNYFTGELYIDTQKSSYKALGFRRFNMLSIFPAVLGSKGRAAISRSRAEEVGGDFRGDGMQNGGALVVTAGGEKCLLFYKQDNPADEVDKGKIFEVLNISD